MLDSVRRNRSFKLERLENRELLTAFTYFYSENLDQNIPVETYRYAEGTSGVGTITTQRTSVGVYDVRIRGMFPDLVIETDPAFHVTAYGFDSAHCKPSQWGPSLSNPLDFLGEVRCFDSDGHLTDSRFTGTIIGETFSHGAYAVVSDPSVDQLIPDDAALNLSGDVQFRRFGTGNYQVTFEDVGYLLSQGSHVQTTATNDDANRCVVSGWIGSDDITTWVRCVDPSGTPIDSPFVTSLLLPQLTDNEFAFTYTAEPAESELVLPEDFTWNPSLQGFDKIRMSEGHYRVEFTGLNPSRMPGGHVAVTGYGSSAPNCKIGFWSSIDFFADVRCYDSSGNPADARFTILGIPADMGRVDLYEPNDTPDAATLLFDHDDGQPLSIHSPTDEDHFRWMNVSGPGEVRFLTSQLTSGGNLGLEVIGLDGTVYASSPHIYGKEVVIDSELGDVYSIRVFSEDGFTNSHYVLQVDAPNPLLPRPRTSEVSFADFGLGLSGIGLRSGRSFNQSGEEITSSQSAVGAYDVVFHGLSDIVGSGGNVQVNSNLRSTFCNVGSWSSNSTTDDFTARVRCFDESGVPADSSFQVLVIPPENDFQFSYAWSSSLSSDGSTNPIYTYNPNGDVSVRWKSNGKYEVQFDGLGSASLGGNVQVTPYGTSPNRCTIDSWQTSIGGDFRANVACVAPDGTPANSQFSMAVIPPGVETEVLYTWSFWLSPNEWPLDENFTNVPGGGVLVESTVGFGSYEIEPYRNSQKVPTGAAFATAHGVDATHCSANVAFPASYAITCDASPADFVAAGYSLVAIPKPDYLPTFDISRDGSVDEIDLSLLCTAIHHYRHDIFDFSGDGEIDLDDMSEFVHNGLGTFHGDANLDGIFNSSDLIQVFAAGEYEDDIPNNSTWREGDWNCDGEFDSSDLIRAFADGGYSLSASPMTDSVSRLTNARMADLAMALIYEEPNHKNKW